MICLSLSVAAAPQNLKKLQLHKKSTTEQILHKKMKDAGFPEMKIPEIKAPVMQKAGADRFEPDTMYVHYADDPAQAFERHVCTYSEKNGAITSYIYGEWNGTTFVNVEKNTYTYESRKTIDLYETSNDGTSWKLESRQTYTYNSKNNLTEYLKEKYEGGWKGEYKLTYTYDTDNKKILNYLFESMEGEKWVKTSQINYTYTANHTVAIYQTFVDGNPVNVQKVTTAFEGDQVNSILFMNWIGETWKDARRYLYTYKKNEYTDEYQESIGVDKWLPVEKYTYKFDDNDYPLSELYQEYDETSEKFVNVSLDTFTYEGNKITVLYQEWNPTATPPDFENVGMAECTLTPHNLPENIVWKEWNTKWEDVYQLRWVYDENNNSTECAAYVMGDPNWEPTDDELFLIYNCNDFFEALNSDWYFEGYKVTAHYTKVAVDVGIETITNDPSQITVYPNPTTGQLRITNYELRIDNVEIFDVMGKKLSSHHLIPTSSNQLDISRFPAGIYFLKMTTETEIVTKKVIKN